VRAIVILVFKNNKIGEFNNHSLKQKLKTNANFLKYPKMTIGISIFFLLKQNVLYNVLYVHQCTLVYKIVRNIFSELLQFLAKGERIVNTKCAREELLSSSIS